jgi:hypothetical protein
MKTHEMGVQLDWELEQPTSQLSTEDGEWINNGRITRDDIEVACQVGCKECNEFGQCVGGCADTHREHNW